MVTTLSQTENIVGWETPFQNLKHVSMCRLDDQGVLEVLIGEALPESAQVRGRLWRVAFDSVEAYRVSNESWCWLETDSASRSLMVLNSIWVRHLAETHPLFNMHNDRIFHFAILAMDEVVEVLSRSEPSIKEITRFETEDSQ